MILVIDTNIVLSAALRDRDPEAVILFACETTGVRWVASRAIVMEYRAVLARPKFGLSPDLLARWDAVFTRHVEFHEPTSPQPFLRDSKDAMFLDCAHSVAADFLITGDRDLRDPEVGVRLGHTIVISASLFKRLVCDRHDRT